MAMEYHCQNQKRFEYLGSRFMFLWHWIVSK